MLLILIKWIGHVYDFTNQNHLFSVLRVEKIMKRNETESGEVNVVDKQTLT
jgi:hypothetical protein